MQGATDLDEIKRKIDEAFRENKISYILLNVPSMLHETNDAIRLEVEKFNQLIDYLLQNSKRVYVYYSRRKCAYYL